MATGTAFLMIVLDTSIVNLALSKASRKLGQSLATVSRVPSLRQPRHRYITGLDQDRASVSTEMRMAPDLRLPLSADWISSHQPNAPTSSKPAGY
jgi:hypothetical protein